MNADASHGVDVETQLGLKIPRASRITVGLIVAGIVVVILGALVISSTATIRCCRQLGRYSTRRRPGFARDRSDACGTNIASNNAPRYCLPGNGASLPAGGLLAPPVYRLSATSGVKRR